MKQYRIIFLALFAIVQATNEKENDSISSEKYRYHDTPVTSKIQGGTTKISNQKTEEQKKQLEEENSVKYNDLKKKGEDKDNYRNRKKEAEIVDKKYKREIDKNYEENIKNSFYSEKNGEDDYKYRMPYNYEDKYKYNDEYLLRDKYKDDKYNSDKAGAYKYEDVCGTDAWRAYFKFFENQYQNYLDDLTRYGNWYNNFYNPNGLI